MWFEGVELNWCFQLELLPSLSVFLCLSVYYSTLLLAAHPLQFLCQVFISMTSFSFTGIPNLAGHSIIITRVPGYNLYFFPFSTLILIFSHQTLQGANFKSDSLVIFGGEPCDGNNAQVL